MRKATLWIGLILLLGGVILIYLSGLSGSDMQPTVPALYGTNQTLWTALAIIGLIIFIIGIVLHFTKKNQSN